MLIQGAFPVSDFSFTSLLLSFITCGNNLVLVFSGGGEIGNLQQLSSDASCFLQAAAAEAARSKTTATTTNKADMKCYFLIANAHTLCHTHTASYTHTQSHLSRHLSQGLCNPPAVAIFEPQRLFFVELLQAKLRAAGQVAKCCSSNSDSDGSSSFKMQMHLTPVGQLFVAISRMQQTHTHTETHTQHTLQNLVTQFQLVCSRCRSRRQR